MWSSVTELNIPSAVCNTIRLQLSMMPCPQVEGAAVEYAATKLHEIKQARGLPTLSASFIKGNLFEELQSGRLAELFDCLHVGGSCTKDKIRELLRLVKPGTENICTLHTSASQSRVNKRLARTGPHARYVNIFSSSELTAADKHNRAYKKAVHLE